MRALHVAQHRGAGFRLLLVGLDARVDVELLTLELRRRVLEPDRDVTKLLEHRPRVRVRLPAVLALRPVLRHRQDLFVDASPDRDDLVVVRLRRCRLLGLRGLTSINGGSGDDGREQADERARSDESGA